MSGDEETYTLVPQVEYPNLDKLREWEDFINTKKLERGEIFELSFVSIENTEYALRLDVVGTNKFLATTLLPLYPDPELAESVPMFLSTEVTFEGCVVAPGSSVSMQAGILVKGMCPEIRFYDADYALLQKTGQKPLFKGFGDEGEWEMTYKETRESILNGTGVSDADRERGLKDLDNNLGWRTIVFPNITTMNIIESDDIKPPSPPSILAKD